ncbi:hypothetical protein [Clostridium butyricum]|uniref:Uncharacterized protein n=1 Tax=Clostridium butyricum E4 str. BoNT E BL5262 TaxID=632245 RepID=C4IBS5_CLOBU|nr:hypothetical protein [Clostridium butyricum]APF21460.1 hypothetical protein NPD4_3948 [Clostridium butyricum]EDT74067.1 hypothetical protein CBY_1745 [Clostridium butyricum 5521]EEP56259.1 hypothetical protein CLP_0598 [Clostridium butyricum E4 str. BoNT E BL5262]
MKDEILEVPEKIFCYSGIGELEAAKLKETLDIIIKGLIKLKYFFKPID